MLEHEQLQGIIDESVLKYKMWVEKCWLNNNFYKWMWLKSSAKQKQYSKCLQRLQSAEMRADAHAFFDIAYYYDCTAQYDFCLLEHIASSNIK